MRILVLEPYYGGSHRHFLDGLMATVEAEFLLFSLPARKWKMRMQLSALWFYEQIRQLPLDDRFFQTVLCSTFVDVATLRALLQTIDGWNASSRFCTYFHENQFAYPGQVPASDKHQFTAINFTTALLSDSCAFNSSYNQKTFFAGVQQYLKKTADMELRYSWQTIKNNSLIIHPGLDFSNIDSRQISAENEIPVIVWNHRWEHDKDPEAFFLLLYRLQDAGIPFQLIVLGQSFARKPDCFQMAEKRLVDHIIHFGYVDSQEEYGSLLCRSDVVISTAQHEFFGLAVIEAVRAGCRPFLPERLSYPELFPAEFLYTEKTAVSRLKAVLQNRRKLTADQAEVLTRSFEWINLKDRYTEWLMG